MATRTTPNPVRDGLAEALISDTVKLPSDLRSREGLAAKLVEFISKAEVINQPVLNAIDKLTKLMGLNKQKAHNFERMTPRERINRMLECREGLEAIGIEIIPDSDEAKEAIAEWEEADRDE